MAGISEKEPNRTYRNEKYVIMKLETSMDQTPLKQKSSKLEDGAEENTQNAMQRDNSVGNRKN